MLFPSHHSHMVCGCVLPCARRVLTWAHEAGNLLQVAAILAVCCWPIPIMLLLSAGTESDLPVRMPAMSGVDSGALKGSIPNSPAPSQPGSPFVDTTRLRMRHSLQPRGSVDGSGRMAVGVVGGATTADTTHQPDQSAGFLGGMHMRKGSGGSEGSGSFSSSISAAWGIAERLQQQPGYKKHRSRFVQAMHRLQEAVGMEPAGATVLPLADAHKR